MIPTTFGTAFALVRSLLDASGFALAFDLVLALRAFLLGFDVAGTDEDRAGGSRERGRRRELGLAAFPFADR